MEGERAPTQAVGAATVCIVCGQRMVWAPGRSTAKGWQPQNGCGLPINTACSPATLMPPSTKRMTVEQSEGLGPACSAAAQQRMLSSVCGTRPNLPCLLHSKDWSMRPWSGLPSAPLAPWPCHLQVKLPKPHPKRPPNQSAILCPSVCKASPDNSPSPPTCNPNCPPNRPSAERTAPDRLVAPARSLGRVSSRSTASAGQRWGVGV